MPEKKRATLICLLLAVVTLAVYWPAIHFDFTNYDDPDYILLNLPIQHGVTRASVAWAFTTSHAGNWHPLTWISHAADCALFGLNPGGHHLTNLLFHAANAVLLFLVLWQLTGAQWRSALVAALFAWHPLHVESVAWVSERKDVLSAFFFILTIGAYARFVRTSQNPRDAAKGVLLKSKNRGKATMDRPKGIVNSKTTEDLNIAATGDGRTPGFGQHARNASSPAAHHATPYYLLSLFFFTLALLAKPMVVTLPCVLLLLDFWPLNRVSWPKLFLEKIPFFALAALDCLATFWSQKESNSVVSAAVLPFSARLANALVSYVLYLWKTIWPVDLALPYPYSHEWTFVPTAAAALFLLLVTAVVLFRARRQPFLAVGWFWFLGTLVPVIGLVQVGLQFMADRYSYVPLIGIFIAVAWAIPSAWTQWPRPGFVFAAVVAGALLFLLTGTEVQLQYWRNSITLFSHTVTVTSNNILAEYNLAEALARAGREEEAVTHYEAALAMHPNRVEVQYNSQTQAHYNLGLIFRSQKKWPDAEAQFRAFIRDEPREPNGRLNLGVVLVALGRADEAAEEFRQAIRLRPVEPGENEAIEVLAKIEAAYFETGQINEAIAAAQKTRDAAILNGRMDLAAAAEKRLAIYRDAKH